MPRKPDPKCVYCAKNYLSEDLAQKKNGNCYVKRNRACYQKRNRIRNASKINAQRRLNNARDKGVTIIDPIIPDTYRAELIIYGKENISIHAIAIDLFRGNLLTHQMPAQHTQGLRQAAVEKYLDDVIERLIDNYDVDCFGSTYWVDSSNCPICKGRKEELGIQDEPDEVFFALPKEIKKSGRFKARSFNGEVDKLINETSLILNHWLPNIADGFVSNSLNQIDCLQTSPLSDRMKLDQSGNLMYQASTHVLDRVKLILENLFRSPVAQGDTKIDHSFSDFLRKRTQQTISTGFLVKYLQPRLRATYKRESTVKIESLTPSEALEIFEPEILESEVLSLAHDEDIDAWLECVTSCVRNNPRIDNLGDIVKVSGLSLAQVFISLLFGDFQLTATGDFYDYKSIKVFNSSTQKKSLVSINLEQ